LTNPDLIEHGYRKPHIGPGLKHVTPVLSFQTARKNALALMMPSFVGRFHHAASAIAN
jgi:hypothetical protein